MKNKTVEQLIKFEEKIKELFEQGDLPFMMHFCGGNEQQLIDIFEKIKEGDYIFSTHRSHYHYLLAGGLEEDLSQRIKDGDSMFIFNKKLNFLTSSIVAGTPCLAAGVALALKNKNSDERVWCFIGDGAEDEGHFYEAVRYVDGWNLPCTFIVEDNNRSVDSEKKDRYGKSEMIWPACVWRYEYKPTYPHIGSGCNFIIKFKDVKPRAHPDS